MTLPRILVVDDQYARDPAERMLFLRRTGLVAASPDEDGEGPGTDALGVAVFCSGQRRNGDGVVNDYEVVRRAVLENQETGVKPLALVLLDVRFDSGPLLNDGTPAGSSADDGFGGIVHQRLGSEFPDLPVVMLSSLRQEEIEDQAVPYLSKIGLDSAVLRTTLLRHARLDADQSNQLLGLPPDVVAGSQGMRDVFLQALEHTDSGANILVLGETGTGKEVVARYIHDASPRRTGPFVAVNLAALPAELVESELFGHERGAFTGAAARRRGRFELAQGGTLFLDEIGDMPAGAQAKVLRALQQRTVERLGGGDPIPVDIRLISATSRDLPGEVGAGRFRDDLYYRVNTVPIRIPPLRERRDDVIPLAEAFLQRFMGRHGKVGITFSDGARERLLDHPFRGNVRELENLVERLTATTGNNRIIAGEEVSAALKAGGVRGAPADGPSEEEATARKQAALGTLPAIMEAIRVDPLDPDLPGAKARLEAAFQQLLKRIAGAALERCRDPVSGELNRQRAMQLLAGDPDLKGKGPARLVNQILGRRQNASSNAEDLEELVKLWRHGEDSRS
jgi:two-component system, NtrC family, nitrogen regulation response regulator GlnG